MDREEINFDRIKENMNSGDPAKIVSPLTYLKKTILDMHGAQNRLTNMVNADLKGPGHFNFEELATLAEINKSIESGLGYLDALQHIFDEVGVVDLRGK